MEEGDSVSQRDEGQTPPPPPPPKQLPPPLLTVHRLLLKQRGHGGAFPRPVALPSGLVPASQLSRKPLRPQSPASPALGEPAVAADGTGRGGAGAPVGGRPWAPGCGQPPSPLRPRPCDASHSPAELGRRAASVRAGHVNGTAHVTRVFLGRGRGKRPGSSFPSGKGGGSAVAWKASACSPRTG